jgi:cytochrome c oxidase subunit 3
VLLGVLFTSIQVYEYNHIPREPVLSEEAERRALRLDLLHGHRLPRLPRARRHHLPARLPDPSDERRLHPQAALRLRSAAWYWHFVDVVWLFLFAFIYVIFGTAGH